MKNIKILLLLITLSFPIVSLADCEKWINHLVEKYHSSRGSDKAVCKIWPADESKTIVVLPFPKEMDGTINYDLDVLLVDTQSGELIARNWEPDAFYSDAIELTDFEIDTARYQLNNKSRDFGIRTNFAHNPYSFSFSEQLINLYVQQNEKLNRVVNKLILKQSVGEWHECDGEYNRRNAVLLLGKNANNNYKDLSVSYNEQKEIIKLNRKRECVKEITKQTKRKYILYYNGVEYPLPKNLRNEY